jgi:hypothetical protein
VPQVSDSPAVAEPRSRRRTIGYAAAMLFVLAATIMWIYAFFFASRRSPDKVPDRAWAVAAQTVCLDTKGRIDALPVAGTFRTIEPLTEALRQRALVLDQANDILAEQIARIRAQVPADAETARITGEWLADWDLYLEDRRAHSLELEAGKDVPFTERTHKESPMSNRMNAFARVNEMPRCQTPQDLA